MLDLKGCKLPLAWLRADWIIKCTWRGGCLIDTPVYISRLLLTFVMEIPGPRHLKAVSSAQSTTAVISERHGDDTRYANAETRQPLTGSSMYVVDDKSGMRSVGPQNTLQSQKKAF